jgi:sigma-B regulation protein RsbU (phosphoserine phosphatase)
MLYLVADTVTGRVRFYRAGHNEPLLLRPGEPPLYLSGGGPLIGFQLPRNRSELQEIQLRPGDRLVVYSDGINEAVDAKGNLYGLERMAKYLSLKNGAGLQSALDGLVEDVRHFSQSPTFEDDVSMVGFAWNPSKG